MVRTEIIANYQGFDPAGIPVSKGVSLSEGNVHTKKFMISLGMASLFTAATCIYPPAAGGGFSLLG